MPRMSGGEAMVQSLVREGVDTVFGIPGIHMNGSSPLCGTTPHPHDHDPPRAGRGAHGRRLRPRIGEAGNRHGRARHGRLQRRRRRRHCIRPLLARARHRRSDPSRPGRQEPRGPSHEIMEQGATLAPVTKWRRQVLTPRDVPGAVSEAFRQMRTGRPVPSISRCLRKPAWSATRSSCGIPPLPRASCRARSNCRKPPASSPRPSARSYSREAAWPNRARKRPSSHSPKRPASRHYLWRRQGRHPGQPPPLLRLMPQPPCGRTGDERTRRRDAVRRCRDRHRDTRFSMGNPAGEASTLININIDDSELTRVQANTIPLHGDAKATIEALLPHLAEAGAGDRSSPEPKRSPLPGASSPTTTSTSTSRSSPSSKRSSTVSPATPSPSGT